MSHRPLTVIAVLITVLFSAACEKRKPTATKKTGAAEEAAEPDTLLSVGTDAASLVQFWALSLSQVETDESAATAHNRLVTISDQFDALVERAEKLPPLGQDEFKRVDDEIDALLGKATGDLQPQRQRIFLLPESIKEQVLPTHDLLVRKFRTMSRSMLAKRKRPAGDTRDQKPDATPAGDSAGEGESESERE